MVTSMPVTLSGNFNANNPEWLCHSHTTDVEGLFCQELDMAQDLTQIVDFLMISSHIFMTYSFVLIRTFAWENLTIW